MDIKSRAEGREQKAESRKQEKRPGVEILYIRQMDFATGLRVEGKSGMRRIVLGIVEKEDQLLVSEWVQSVTGRICFRPLGGGLEEGEVPREGLIREFREELGTEIDILEELPTLENVYHWADRSKHEVAYLFRIRLRNEAFYAQEQIPVLDSTEVAFWKPVQDFLQQDWLIPEGLIALLTGTPAQSLKASAD